MFPFWPKEIIATLWALVGGRHPPGDITSLIWNHSVNFLQQHKTYEALSNLNPPIHFCIPISCYLPSSCSSSLPGLHGAFEQLIWEPLLLSPCLEHTSIVFSWISPSCHSIFSSDLSLSRRHPYFLCPSITSPSPTRSLLGAYIGPWIPITFRCSCCCACSGWHVDAIPQIVNLIT